jgi:hypothetical protein
MRLFLETAFTQKSHSSSEESEMRNQAAVRRISCISCHSSRGVGDDIDTSIHLGLVATDGSDATTSRSSGSIGDVFVNPTGIGLLHSDGEFASAESLVKETFLGRNFGWLPSERAEAIRYFAQVIRADDGAGDGAAVPRQFSYSTLLRGTDPAIPRELRLPEDFRCDVDDATDEEILHACSRLVVEYMRTLQFSRDSAGLHDGSPYDAFLAANRLPRGPSAGQSSAEYGRRLAELAAGLRAPRFIDEPSRTQRSHGSQPFRFGPLELEGMRIFFRGAIGADQKTGAGNCAECHVPPQFSDFRFHNTGSAQDEYDEIHGPGAFARLTVPDLAARETDFNRWLPATPAHPDARGSFRSVPDRAHAERTDLGVWNVYGNPDLPAPQATLESLLNPGGTFTSAQVLERSIARFKTSMLRDLGSSPPYLHTGRMRTLEDVIEFYRRMGELAQAGKLRNAPAEYFAMRLGPVDIAPLAAFLRALDEVYGRDPAVRGKNNP